MAAIKRPIKTEPITSIKMGTFNKLFAKLMATVWVFATAKYENNNPTTRAKISVNIMKSIRSAFKNFDQIKARIKQG